MESSNGRSKIKLFNKVWPVTILETFHWRQLTRRIWPFQWPFFKYFFVVNHIKAFNQIFRLNFDHNRNRNQNRVCNLVSNASMQKWKSCSNSWVILFYSREVESTRFAIMIDNHHYCAIKQSAKNRQREKNLHTMKLKLKIHYTVVAESRIVGTVMEVDLIF